MTGSLRFLLSLAGLALGALALPVAALEAPTTSPTPTLRAELASARQALAERRLDDARELYAAAAEAALELGEENLPLAQAIDGQGDVARLSGRLEQAVKHYRASAVLWESLLGEEQPRLATTLHNLGVVQLDLDQLDDARKSLERAQSIWDTAFGPDSPHARNTRRAVERLDTATARRAER